MAKLSLGVDFRGDWDDVLDNLSMSITGSTATAVDFAVVAVDDDARSANNGTLHLIGTGFTSTTELTTGVINSLSVTNSSGVELFSITDLNLSYSQFNELSFSHTFDTLMDDDYINTPVDGFTVVDGDANDDGEDDDDLDDDVLKDSGEDDYMDGGAGDDILNGGKGDDFLVAGAGRDNIKGGVGDDDVFGGDGNDIENGGDGNDSMSGGAGDDIEHGGRGDDDIFGGAGNDKLNGNSGNDYEDGGDGDDTITGGVGDDILSGSAGADVIRGDVGVDHLLGGSGDDILMGGVGNDVLNGGLGTDKLYGQVGDDTFVFDSLESQPGVVDYVYGFKTSHDHINIVASAFGGVSSATVTDYVTIVADSTNSKLGHLYYDADGVNGAGVAVELAVIQGKINIEQDVSIV